MDARYDSPGIFVVVLGRGFVNYSKHLCATHAQLSTTADELCELLCLPALLLCACGLWCPCLTSPDHQKDFSDLSSIVSLVSSLPPQRADKFSQMHRSSDSADAKIC